MSWNITAALSFDFELEHELEPSVLRYYDFNSTKKLDPYGQVN